jgi:hypothetical protein
MTDAGDWQMQYIAIMLLAFAAWHLNREVKALREQIEGMYRNGFWDSKEEYLSAVQSENKPSVRLGEVSQ